MSHPEVDLLTSTQVADMFSVTRKTVGIWARSGALRPSWKSPGPVGAYLFDRATVEAALAARMDVEAYLDSTANVSPMPAVTRRKRQRRRAS